MDRLAEMIEEVCGCPQVSSLAVLTCDANGFEPANLDRLLRSVPLPLFGGLFPALIHGRSKLERGSLVVGWPFTPQVHVIEGLSDPRRDFDAALDECVPAADSFRTMLVFVDGLAKRIEAFIESLFSTFGMGVNYIGGGAGSLSLVPKPCLFSNQGLAQDSALLVQLQTRSGIGVSHGWESISGPFRVTEAEHNRIISLDWLPAVQVYREVVQMHSGRPLQLERFFDLASAYPFGITKMEGERVVRDPIQADEQGGLTCVGEVPEGAFVDILHGNNTSLIQAAGRAYSRAADQFGPRDDHAATLFIDCISRVCFLKERFDDELGAVFCENHPLLGICSLGEIANSGDDYLEFYNKTAVVGILEVP